MKYTWLIDSGHGGIFSDGKYPTAPSKMFQHGPDKIFYEGQFNRIVKHGLIAELFRLGKTDKVIDVCPTNLDLSLNVRCDIVNALDNAYDDCILLDLHSNAGGGTGIEVFAHPSSGRSQNFGNVFGQVMKDSFPGVKFRPGNDQLCKTANFQMLRETNCPAILPEFMFYDHYEDYIKLTDSAFIKRYVDSLVQFIVIVEESQI